MQFEDIKQEVVLLEDIEDIKSNPVVSSFTNLLRNIPFYGDLVCDSLDKAFEDFQTSKRNEFYDYIISSPELITTEKVNDITILMEFAKTLDVINKLANNDKVKYIARLFKTSFFEISTYDISEYEEFLNRINDLSYKEIEILFLLKKYEKDVDMFYKSVDETFQIKRETITGILGGISRSGFCKELTGNLFIGNPGGWFHTTRYFDRFLELLHIEL